MALFSLHQCDGWVNIAPMNELDLQAAQVTPLAEILRPKTLDDVVGQQPLLGPQGRLRFCLLYTSPSPRDATLSRMPSSA